MTAEPWDRRLAGLETTSLDGGLTLHVARSYRILRTNSVHTFGMRFPLDLVWLGRRGQVLRVDSDVPARRMKTCVRARSVIETPAGQGDRFARALDPS